MKTTIESLNQEAERNEGAMSTNDWWARRDAELERGLGGKKEDRDVRVVGEAREELRKYQTILSTGKYGYQIWGEITKNQDTIYMITHRRPELADDGDTALLAIEEGR